MTDPSIILEEIEKGFEYYGYLVSKEISISEAGNNSCGCESYDCLLFILKSLEWRLEQELYDDITESLYKKLVLSIMTIIVNTIGVVYYGLTSSGTIPSLKDILKSASINITKNINLYTIPYQANNGYKYLWFAEPATEPIKTIYLEVADPDNSGNIGSITDFINKPTLISGSINYHLYMSNYPTIISGPYTFKVNNNVEDSIYFGYTSTDPIGNENIPTLQFSKVIIKGSSEYTLKFTNDANLNYIIIKEPVTEPIKTIWVNTPIYNEGEIPDTKMRAGVIIGGFRYYVSRVPFALDIETSNITLRT